MWIKNLLLSNIQSYKDERIELSRSINLLVGKNNSGKSAIIRAIMSFQANGLVRPESLLRKFESAGFVLATIEDFKNRPTMKVIGDNELPAILFDAESKQLSYLTLPSPLPEPQALAALLGKLINRMGMMQMSQFPDKEPHNLLVPFLSKRKLQYISGNFDSEAVTKVDHDFRNLSSKLSRATGNTLKKEFETACVDLVGFVPAVLPGNHNQTTIGHYVGPNDSIPLDQMGDGVTQTIGLVISLLQEKGKIFVIEEPENDFHPDALKKLLQLIAKASDQNQFIISTHSNIVLRFLGANAGSKLFEITSTLHRNETEKTELFRSSAREVENSTDQRIQILEALGYELSDSHLFVGYLILEESSAEKLIRDFLIPAFVPSLVNQLGTIGAKGAADVPIRFSTLQSLFTYIHKAELYHNRAWVCVDGDDEGKKAVLKCKESFKTKWDPKHFMTFTKSNFEEFYPNDYKSRVEIIQKTIDGNERGRLKLALADQVVQEFKADPKRTMKRFEEPAREVIELLQMIEQALS